MALDLATQQRALVGDWTSGWRVGASFLAKTGAATAINFTATAMAGEELTALKSLLKVGERLENAWHFTASGTGYNAADPVYLSFTVGEEFTRSDVRLWRFNGTTWQSYSANDLTCANGHASFTVTGFSGYAVSAVPEPSALALLGAGAWLAIAAGRRRWWPASRCPTPRAARNTRRPKTAPAGTID